jgi:cyclic pyranopterin phosphate synthase
MNVSLGMPVVRGAAADDSPDTAARMRERSLAATRAGLDSRAGDAPHTPGLHDRFGRRGTDLRISLTDKCNLRCTYCMPAEGMNWMPQSSLLTAAEVIRLVAGVRERHPDLPIALTTNGIGLTRRAETLARAGLTRINVSLDTIDADTYRQLARRDRLADVLAGIDAAQEAGLAPVKLNAVLMRGVNDEQAPDLLAFALARGVRLRFIEQMPLDGDHGWTREGMVTAAEVRDRLSQHWDLTPDQAPRDGAPAELWTVTSRTREPRVLGTVGVIASVTEPFCSACTRTRITAEGRVRSCLFSHEEFDLAGALRAGESDAVIARMWQQAMWLKPAAHGMGQPGLDSDAYVQPERSMSAIGG